MSPGAFDASKDEWRSYKGSAHFVCPDCDRTSPCEVKVGTTEVRCGRCKAEFGEADWLSAPPFPAQPDLTTPYKPCVVHFEKSQITEFMQEDVAVVWREYEPGISAAYAMDDGRLVGVRWPLSHRSASQATRDEVIEECARIADRLDVGSTSVRSPYLHGSEVGSQYAAQSIAKAIRALRTDRNPATQEERYQVGAHITVPECVFGKDSVTSLDANHCGWQTTPHSNKAV